MLQSQLRALHVLFIHPLLIIYISKSATICITIDKEDFISLFNSYFHTFGIMFLKLSHNWYFFMQKEQLIFIHISHSNANDLIFQMKDFILIN